MSSFLGTQSLGACGSLSGRRLCGQAQTPRVQHNCCTPVRAGAFGPGKKWESYDLNKNGKPVRIPMHVKTGDTVVVIAGRDKGKVGEVSKVLTKQGKIVVEGVNVKAKTVQPKPGTEERGQIVQTETPVHHSNVMHWSKEQKVRSRIRQQETEGGKKVRVLVKTGEVIDK
ncbi:g733 [Coccomyxa viridis]|uniref:G733 protein n=1 Tax=Coccomyxa viridis TaxID=1274662 RepID=A0ABP1FGD6_9CHLO